MERWEYLLVRVQSAGGRQFVLEPYRSGVETNLQNVTDSNTVALLDELGQEGWELVAVDFQVESYWLKKRATDPEDSQAGFGSL